MSDLCRICGLTFPSPSYGGLAICSACDCGIYNANTLAQRNWALTAELAEALRERDEAETAVSRYENTMNERDRELVEARAEIQNLGTRSDYYEKLYQEARTVLEAWRSWYWDTNSYGIDVSTLDRTDACLADRKQRNISADEIGELWDADPNCSHELDPNSFSGIRCLKCPGWFCF